MAPRVGSACFSTVWNRWTTCRRFQQRRCDENKCLLACSPTAEDSIEHYSRCAVVRRVGATMLGMEFPSTLHMFRLCDPRISSPDDLTMSALLVYATYRTTNVYRTQTGRSTTEALDTLRQCVREGVRDHHPSTRVLDNRWNAASREEREPENGEKRMRRRLRR